MDFHTYTRPLNTVVIKDPMNAILDAEKHDPQVPLWSGNTESCPWTILIVFPLQ
jgi:hypothetical protein